MHAYRRIEAVADEGSFIPWFEGMQTKNPLNFEGYPEKITKLQEKTGLDEAVITGEATIDGSRVALLYVMEDFYGKYRRVVGER